MGEDDYHHFRTSSGWHCFDDYYNVYAQDGTLVHDASLASQLDESDPSFYIDAVPYWFSSGGLLSLDAEGIIYCVPTWPNKHYFHTSSGWYFFDDHRNVYSEDGTLVPNSSFNTNMGMHLAPTFYIDGASYWFILDKLWCQASADTLYHVHTWKSEPERSPKNLYCFFASDQFYYLDIRRNLYSKDGTLIYDGSSSVLTDKLHIPNFHIGNTPYWLHTDGLLSRNTDDTICRVLAWVQDLYSFHTPHGLRYFDRQRNVYSDKGAYVYKRLHHAESDGVTPLVFQIDGDSYWFDQDDLWCQASIDTLYRVHTWQSELNRHSPDKKYCFFTSGHFYYLDDHQNVYSEDGTLFYNGPLSMLTNKLELQDPNFHIGSAAYWLHKDGLLSRSADGTTCRVLGWVRDLCSLSYSMSPSSIESTTNGGRTPDTLLFAESDPSYIRGMSTSSQHRTANNATNRDHLRCPVCGKVHRRLVALREHMRTHTGEKPNVCLYKGCNIGFATKSNMRRHFDTHRAGCTLEEYERTMPTQSRPTSPKYHFHVSSRFYYFDSHRRVYSEDGTLVHDGSLSLQTDHRPPLVFLLDGVLHWFNQDNLMYQNADGIHTVHAWQSGSDVIGPNMSMHEMFHHLIHHGCTNLSSQMDTQQDTAIIMNGGGFGDIWLGRMNNGTQVAIKAWRASFIEQCDYKVLKRATREIYLWSRLKHDNIQPLMGVIIFKGRYLGMVSQWMENGDLYGYMRKNPDSDRYKMSVQVASGLAYMHQCDVVHGDLRTANILVSSDGVPRLTDFGLSTMSEAGLAFSKTPTTQAGTLRWASPEQLVEESSNSKESDVYALGMTILEIFTGNVPYYPECQKDFHVMKKLEHGIHPTRPTDRFGDDKRGNQMWKLLVSCWDRTPSSRPTAEEVVESLNSISSM